MTPHESHSFITRCDSSFFQLHTEWPRKWLSDAKVSSLSTDQKESFVRSFVSGEKRSSHSLPEMFCFICLFTWIRWAPVSITLVSFPLPLIMLPMDSSSRMISSKNILEIVIVTWHQTTTSSEERVNLFQMILPSHGFDWLTLFIDERVDLFEGENSFDGVFRLFLWESQWIESEEWRWLDASDLRCSPRLRWRIR